MEFVYNWDIKNVCSADKIITEFNKISINNENLDYKSDLLYEILQTYSKSVNPNLNKIIKKDEINKYIEDIKKCYGFKNSNIEINKYSIIFNNGLF